MTLIVQTSTRTTSPGPRSRRRRRLLVTALLAALTSGPVLSACSTEGQRDTAPNSDASAQQADGNNDAHAAATRGSTVSATVCPRPDVHLIVGDTTLAVPTDSTTGRLTVRVGQVIYLQAEGICTRSVSATPRNADLNRPIVRVEATPEVAPGHGDRTYKAVRPGRVILDISMSACEQPPGTPRDGCFGGPSRFGAVTVVVHR
jgi:hypothetical protein